MFSWLGALSGALKLANWLAKQAEKNQHMDTGASLAIKVQLEGVLENVDRAKLAARAGGAYRKRVRDKYARNPDKR